jgi:transketolase
MPSWELFEHQDRDYRDETLPPGVTARVAVEAGAVIGWDRYAGADGTIIGMHRFGGSAPGPALMQKFGFVADRVLQAAKDQIAKHRITESAGKRPR